MLSDHVFHFFGSTIAITSYAQFVVVMIMIACIVVAAGTVKRLRRKRTTLVKRSAFHDQVMDELKRFDDAIERSGKRQANQAIGAADLTAEQSHTIPPSFLGADTPQGEQSTD